MTVAKKIANFSHPEPLVEKIENPAMKLKLNAIENVNFNGLV